MKNSYLLILSLLLTFSANAQKLVEGNAIRIIDNRKDIYHDKNELQRKLLIKNALIDAVEKGADISATAERDISKMLDKMFKKAGFK